MWWKLTGVWLTTALIWVILLWPVKTHAVKLDMPHGTGNIAAEHTVEFFAIAAQAFGFFVMAVVLVLPFWLSWRIVRSYRKPN
jgi:hypothetical protein